MTETKTTTAEHAFIQEALHAEADAIKHVATRVATADAAAWTAAVDLLATCSGHVIVSGMGKSGLVGAKVSATFTSLGQPSSVLHPAEAVHGDLGRVRRGDVVILLSYSGATDEVVNLALLLKADGVPTLGISSNPTSDLARATTVHLCLGDITEACPLRLAPTASTTAQLALGDALALTLARRRSFSEDDFHRSHPGGMLGVGLRSITDVIRLRVGREIAVVPDHVSVREALLAARPASGSIRRAGAIMLADSDGRLSGIFTDGDLRRQILEDAEMLDRPVNSIMTARPKHLTTDALLRDAERMVREHRVDEIPVVDADGRPVGLIDVQDLVAMKVVRDEP